MSAREPASRSRLVYGCMGLGGPWGSSHYGPAEVDHAAAAIEAARSIGIDRFDHADIYRGGTSESVFGEVIARSAGLRGQLWIQSKVGIRLGEDGLDAYYDLSAAAIRSRVEGILARLRTDYLDLLLLHRPDPLLDPAEVGAAVVRLLEEGTIRAIGVSNFSAAQMQALADHLPAPLAANQLELSLGRPDFVESGILVNHPEGAAVSFPHGTLEHCARTGAEVQAWSPLAGGRFTGRTTPASGSADDRTRADLATADLVRRMAEERGTTPEAVVLGWLMRHPARIAPVIGSATPERIRACAGAEDVAQSMSRPEWYALLAAARGRRVP
ncbi:aldo/keto reductase family oxidoreductase [Sinomonas sp. R1AF57]|uniref:aldo/keto reductase n=1 Tax=Sinomonas sp. R1AF57 TaxID=2020377 RepID=UPI000B5FEEA7|nr:aldo/keto reductase [Sinomonas sp. R1AF57]ASN52755.1 aldo/keto reductase [Sinomonas sp. R1AF57]